VSFPTPRQIRIAVAIVIVATLALVARNQIKVYRNRQARAALLQQREALFDALRPVTLANCELERFGEPHDGGYLMCGNLLEGVESGYSYGIAGYDQWGCDISTRLDVPVHQYDCFDTRQPACPSGHTVFHTECVGEAPRTIEGRAFDTLANQFAKNGDRSKRIALKIDVEGAEWDSFLSAPDGVFERIDQMIVEFHWLRDGSGWRHDERYLRAVQRLEQFFYIAHLHFNNMGCVEGLHPFTTWAYEVLFVNKRLTRVAAPRGAGRLHPLDAPNDPTVEDCQPAVR
jgi:hypothetical protein